MNRRKTWTFRLLAMLLSISPLIIAEGLLRATSVGIVDEVEDPFIGFDTIHPLFVESEDGSEYVVSPARQVYFRPDSFAKVKGEKEFRIFCLGGSTVQGRPYAIETSFTTWLRIGLEIADQNREWEVVNCGGVSYASYRLAPILEEVLNYDPDMIILYTGHNEFLEDRTYDQVKQTAAPIAALHSICSHSRMYNVTRQFWTNMRSPTNSSQVNRPELPAEVDALLDVHGGLDDYHRDDQWKSGAATHFEFNLTRMIESCRRRKVPILLCNPGCDLRDTPPFKSEHRSNLSERERAQLNEWMLSVHEGDLPLEDRATLLKRAVKLDGRFAASHYALARTLDAMGDYESARQFYLRAKEEDICPLRITEPLRDTLLRVTKRTRTPLLDIDALFRERSEHGIPGNRWFIDHVHPNVSGHQLIAEYLLEYLEREGLISRPSDWREEFVRRSAAHIDSLNPAYFVHGQQRLEGLRYWTQGRAGEIGNH